MPFDRGQRFAGPGSESTCDLAERVEDVLLPCRLNLLLIEDAARRAVPGTQAQHVLAAKTGNRPLQNHRARGSLADLLRDFRSHSSVFRLAHQRQRLLDLPVRDQGERRLVELERQPLTQRTVEDGIAGLVVEISQDNRVAGGQPGRRRGPRREKDQAVSPLDTSTTMAAALPTAASRCLRRNLRARYTRPGGDASTGRSSR